MITILIVISTAIISIVSFQRSDLFSKLAFEPFLIQEKKQYFRFITHSFVHADWIHLIVNMLVFFSFGNYVESQLGSIQGSSSVFSGGIIFVLLYFGGTVIASLPTYFKHKNNPNYVSVGASGAVSAVLFTSIFLAPLEKVYFYGILPVPGIIFGGLYLIYSSYMARKGNDNINHDAHFWGAVYGFIFPILVEPSLLKNFFNQF
ncbi:MAG: rhomboid family intramembrane serine protease [Bacteroidales bacterium]